MIKDLLKWCIYFTFSGAETGEGDGGNYPGPFAGGQKCMPYRSNAEQINVYRLYFSKPTKLYIYDKNLHLLM